MRVFGVIFGLVLLCGTAEAKSLIHTRDGQHARYVQHIRLGHYGPCDGIHRCRCGSTQTRHFGLPRNFNGHNLWQAIEWPRAFGRTSPRVGVVVYQHGGGPTGHVSRITQLIDRCTAMVADDAGNYVRNICSRGAIFLDVGTTRGSSVTLSARGSSRRATATSAAVLSDYMSRAGAGT